MIQDTAALDSIVAQIAFWSEFFSKLLEPTDLRTLRDERAATSTLPHPPWRWRENILQLLPDAVVPSKDELAAYWHTVAPKALRYLARRPLKLVRHTRGTTFYHKGRLLPVDRLHL